MKKNITINLFGSLYAIDEDACQLLEQYLSNMKSYFSRREGGDEIADDIEHRVAEIFAELKANGTEAINIGHVQDIIRRIGNPEEMDADNDDTSASDGESGDDASATGQQVPPAPPSGGTTTRKLFRDSDDVMLGGVLSGLCKYFGANDPLPWRVLTVLLALLSLSTVGIVYVIAWAIIPQARTAEERLQMQGRPVNPQSINEELMRAANKARDFVQSDSVQRGARGCLSTMLSVLLAVVELIVLVVCTSILFIVVAIAAVFGAALMGLGPLATEGFIRCIEYDHLIGWELAGAIIFAVTFLLIVLYAVFRNLFRTNASRPTAPGRKLALAAVALVSLTAAITLGIVGAGQGKMAKRALERQENSEGGFYLRHDDRNRLADEGWNVQAYRGCNADGNCYDSYPDWNAADTDIESWTGVLRFEKDNGKQPMQVNLTRTIDLPEGDYRLQVIGASRGRGAYAYATPPSSIVSVSIPPTFDSRRGNLSVFSREQLVSSGIVARGIDDEVWTDYIANDVRLWSVAESQPFHHPGGRLGLGITNMASVAGIATPEGSTSRFLVRQVRVVPASTPLVAATAADSTALAAAVRH